MCHENWKPVDRSISEHSVVELYVCFKCGAEMFRALGGPFIGSEISQLGSLEAERTACRRDGRSVR